MTKRTKKAEAKKVEKLWHVVVELHEIPGVITHRFELETEEEAKLTAASPTNTFAAKSVRIEYMK